MACSYEPSVQKNGYLIFHSQKFGTWLQADRAQLLVIGTGRPFSASVRN